MAFYSSQAVSLSTRTQMCAFKEYNPFFNEQNRLINAASEYPYSDYDDFDEIADDIEAINVASMLQIYIALNKYDPLTIKEIMRVMRMTPKTEYMYIARLLAILACRLNTFNMHYEAETLHRRALCLGTKILGDDHPDLAPSTEWLSYSLFKQAKFEEAVLLLYSTTQLIHESVGPRHPDTAACFFSLAAIVDAIGLMDHATNLRTKAHELMSKYAPAFTPMHECYSEVLLDDRESEIPFYPMLPPPPLHPMMYEMYMPKPYYYPVFPQFYTPCPPPILPPHPYLMMDMAHY